MKNKGTFYYVRLHDINGSLFAHAYTDNAVFLKMFCKSVSENRAIDGITTSCYEFKGSLADFFITIKHDYGLYITGEDIIKAFQLKIPYTNKIVDVLSTCSIMYAGFPDYATRKLLPDTRKRFNDDVFKLALTSKYIRDINLKESMVLLCYVFSKYDGQLSFYEYPDDDIRRTVLDDIYGLMKGWYIPL